MSYKDIKEARIKRATKDTTKGKGKRSRKRKGTLLEADELELDEPGKPDPEPQVAGEFYGRKRKSACTVTARKAARILIDWVRDTVCI